MSSNGIRKVAPRFEQLESRLTPDARAYVADLYTTVLNRTGSDAEINGWVTNIQQGMSTESVARAFLNSPEYSQIEVNRAYQEVFNRNADAGGLAFWTNYLQNGTNNNNDNNNNDDHKNSNGSNTTVDLRVRLFLSAEYQNSHQSNASFIQGLYQDLLNRSPDAGQQYWIDLLNQGNSREKVIRVFLRTDEYLGSEVNRLYTDYFSRTPSAQDRNYWVNVLRNSDDDGDHNDDSGDSRNDSATEFIESSFANSPEFRAQSGI